jgi:hypothetical protein
LTIVAGQSPQHPSAPLASTNARKALGVPVNMQPGNNAILRTCKMCFEQVMAQQKRKELDAEEIAAAADAAKKRKKEDVPLLPQLDQSNIGKPQSQVITPSASQLNDVSSPSLQEQLKSDEDIDISVLQNLPKRNIRLTTLTQRRLKSNDQVLEDEGKEDTVNVRQRVDGIRTIACDMQTLSPSHAKNHSSTFIALADERASGVEEGNKELGSTAATHLEQMAASLMVTDAPLLWKELSEKERNHPEKFGNVASLRSKWVDQLMSLATRCCATVDPNIKRGDLLDIRPYVKIKGKTTASAVIDHSGKILAFLMLIVLVVIPGGTYNDCAYVSGIVFRKTGTNKQMPREIVDPRIMVRA